MSNDKTKTPPAPRPAFRAVSAGELEARRAGLEAKGRAIYAAVIACALLSMALIGLFSSWPF